jgi:hypothetical protein
MDEKQRLKSLTHMDQRQRQKLINYFGRLGERSRIDVHELQTILSRNQPKSEKRDPLFFHAMLLLALSRMKHLETSQTTKSDESGEAIGKITRIRVERIKDMRSEKDSPVKRRIETKYFRMIKKFRNPDNPDHMSWQMVSDYIARYHKERIHRNTLRRCYTQIFEEKKARDEL